MKLQPSGLKQPSPLAWWLALACLFGTWSLGLGATAPGQTHELRVQIVPQFNAAPVVFDKLALTNAAGQLLSVTRLDFLLSDFALHRRDGAWLEQTNWQVFINLRERRSNFRVDVPAGDYDRIRFHVGLPPELNHSNPAQYPANHPLNPNHNGLHWSWAGGYIFFAMEGHWQSGAKKFSGYSFHLGNDPMLMTVELPATLALSENSSLGLGLNLNQLLEAEMTEKNTSTHAREGDEQAARLAKKIAGAFFVDSFRGSRNNGALISRQTNQGLAEPPAPAIHQITPWRFSFPAYIPVPDLPRDNPLSEEGVELGRRLFEEKLLSINNSQSCASCHQAGAAFADGGKRFSVGAEGKEGNRNAMAIFNLAWKNNFFWDGRAGTLRQQVLMPIENPVEMHETVTNVVAKLAQTEVYPAMFAKAFGTPEITGDRLARALEQFLLTKISFDSKFDRVMTGSETFSSEEQRGFELFFTEHDPRRGLFGGDCFHCHGSPFFTTHRFSNNGLSAFSTDPGRYNVTLTESDWGKFITPSLRNVELTAPYMHDGSAKTLEDAVGHYRVGVKRSPNLDPNLAKHPDGGIPLRDQDITALVAFLKTLTDSSMQASKDIDAQARISAGR